MSKVSINIVTWNSMKYLPLLMESIREQSFRDFSVLVVDNASTDGTIEFLREKYPEVTILRNFKNLGFASAHNQAIKYALAAWRQTPLDDRFVLVTNPDIILSPDYLGKIIGAADKSPEAASFGGKLLRVVRTGDGPLEEIMKSNIFDSTGLKILKSRRTLDWGSGEPDRGQYDKETDIFGISGALVLYRALALEHIRIGEEYFDEIFFAYKEDVDLAWRLRLVGSAARFVPEAIAYHFRRAAGKEKAGLWETIANRRTKSDTINFYSYRNHLLMLVKNDNWQNFIFHLPWIFVYELGKFISIIFLEPKTLRAAFDFWRKLPRILTKRKIVMAKSRVGAKEMRRWFQ